MTKDALAAKSDHFDLVVIGSGSGNTLIDEQFSDLRCAIIDRGIFGGTCLNVGCIPTKMFVYPAELMRAAAHLPELGVGVEIGKVQWTKLRDRIFDRIDHISENGRQWRENSENVKVFDQAARFIGPKMLEVGNKTITADQIVLANGSRARGLSVPGIDEVASRLHTSDSIMRLSRLPKSLIIVGGGYIACEFANIFASFGTKVTVVNRSGSLLSRHDREISQLVTTSLAKRVSVRLRQNVTGFSLTPKGVIVDTVDECGTDYEYEAELVLLAMGRLPNADTLNAPAGGIDIDEQGFVIVDEFQRTTSPGVWALGDICSPWMLKHVANAEARTVKHNLLNPHELRSTDHRAIPGAVFTEPQVAVVGLTEEECQQRELSYVVGRQDYADVAYGWAMELPHGESLVKVIIDSQTEEILGAHLAGPQASSLIQPLVMAMTQGVTARDCVRGQYWTHPALVEVVENAILNALESAEQK
ncbi:MAG: mycothione reductase [Propionibacteriaceae bacterium]